MSRLGSQDRRPWCIGRAQPMHCRSIVQTVAFGWMLVLSSPGKCVDLDSMLAQCKTCHDYGVGGAPRSNRAEDWAPRLSRGEAALVRSVREGVPGTLMEGGICAGCSDAEVRILIDRLIDGPKKSA